MNLRSVLPVRSLLMSTSSVLNSEYLLIKLLATAFAVSMLVRQGIALSTALRRILTLSRVGSLPLDEVEMM